MKHYMWIIYAEVDQDNTTIVLMTYYIYDTLVIKLHLRNLKLKYNDKENLVSESQLTDYNWSLQQRYWN